ncbi:MAG: hypothetical protein IT304_05660 [Dehalococcoidia bacterium]|nr:hypothetical protein [Dehalococcoidia bacterium]
MQGAWKPVLMGAAGVALFAVVLGGAATFALSGDDGPSVRRATVGHQQVVSFKALDHAGGDGIDPGLDCPYKGARGPQGSSDPAQY